MLHKATPERLSVFSDGVFAVLITVLVLELRPPELPTFEALLSLWPTWLSYAVSYLFIAIVWINHHYLMHYATEADTSPVVAQFRAPVFHVAASVLHCLDGGQQTGAATGRFLRGGLFLVNATYIGLIWELIGRTPADKASPAVRDMMRFRSITTLCFFGLTAVVALKYPLVGLGICVCCLIVYLRPDPPGAGKSLDSARRGRVTKHGPARMFGEAQPTFARDP